MKIKPSRAIEMEMGNLILRLMTYQLHISGVDLNDKAACKNVLRDFKYSKRQIDGLAVCAAWKASVLRGTP